MHDKNIKGPIPLPWTIALNGYKVSDSEYSTLVWCVQLMRKFYNHVSTVPHIPQWYSLTNILSTD